MASDLPEAQEGSERSRRAFLSLIEDQNRALQALRETRARMDAVLASIDQVIWSVDADTGRVLYLSPAAERVYGRPVQDFVDTPGLWLEVVHPGDRALAEAGDRELRADGRRVTHFRILRPDGGVRWIRDSATAVRDAAGRLVRLDGVISDVTEQKQAEEEIRRYVAQLEGAFMRTVAVATTISEMRDPYTAGHEKRVAEIAVAIGGEMGLDAKRLEGLRVAGYLHDIGKITIPAEILSKPGRLTRAEFELIKGHAQAGYEVLKDVGFPWPVAEVAWQHHERMDGTGYPQGLKGDAIHPEARILAVADVVEAMASHRPYRPGLGVEKALAEIERGRGTAYDPVPADACLRLFRDKGFVLPQ